MLRSKCNFYNNPGGWSSKLGNWNIKFFFQFLKGSAAIQSIFEFQVNPQRQFIIVCGNINFDSVNGFLKDFFHPARDDTNTEVVFLNKYEPDLMFDGLLKREKTRVSYFCVSIFCVSIKVWEWLFSPRGIGESDLILLLEITESNMNLNFHKPCCCQI